MYRQYKNFKKGSIKFVKMPTVKNVLCLFYEKKKKNTVCKGCLEYGCNKNYYL